MEKRRITVAYGDGIGPEIMRATLRILEAAGAPLDYDVIEIGEAVYRKGILSGIPQEAWDVIRANHVLLKAPVTTPQGGGLKSINVTLRKSLGLFANVRPCKAYPPFVSSPHPAMDLVIIRENEEDLYGGIEHQQTREVTQVLKLISLPGTESIVRYAFEYARAYDRKKITCMTKDNIMKITDGLFHRIFNEVAVEYPDIQAEHQIVDIGAAHLAAQPEMLDVIVTPNLYGDILSDVAAQLAGSVGLAGSSNIGREAAMFEAIHGSAPVIAGMGIANPSGLLQAAVLMLVHIGLADTARLINNAWLCTLENGVHTADIFREGLSQMRVGTEGFADAIIDRLGCAPDRLVTPTFQSTGIEVRLAAQPSSVKTLLGVDMFIDWDEAGRDPIVLGPRLEAINDAGLKLKMITNRGVKVYPEGLPETFRTDHWRCRYTAPEGGEISYKQIIGLLQRANAAGLEVIKTENLYAFNGVIGYSLGQGE
jgi:isocitrate dehydrogenase